MGKCIVINISKTLSSKYSQKLIHHAKQSATDALKTASRKSIKNIVTGGLTENKIANKIKKVSKHSPQNNSGIVGSETEHIGFDREMPKERYLSPEKKHKVIDDLGLI